MEATKLAREFTHAIKAVSPPDSPNKAFNLIEMEIEEGLQTGGFSRSTVENRTNRWKKARCEEDRETDSRPKEDLQEVFSG